MARLSLTFLFLLLHLGLTPSIASVNLLGSGESRPRPTILPLYQSPPKPSSIQRRKLHKSDQPRFSNAQMRLYDDLLSNGYYTTRLWIGTPPQEFALIVDTGSTVTYVPCADCEHCGRHQDPRFQPNSSTTYRPVKCSANCNCDYKGYQCTYERRYAEMSSSSGVLAEDVLSFGDESQLSPQRAVFGCETTETGDLYSQRADGIMGLGRGRLSVMDQLVDKGSIRDSFSLCYGGMGIGGGAMILGSIDSPPGMVYAHSDPYRSPYYNIELKELHVAGKPLKLSPKVFDRKYGTVLDSGTTYAYLPGEAFHAFKVAIMGELHSFKQVHGPDPNYNDICFSVDGRDFTRVFPKVDMVFGNGQKLSLTPENYLFRHTKIHGAYCLGVFQNPDQTTLLGGIVVRNTLVTYDREKNKVGFWKTNCSELGKRLNYLSPPPPAPLTSDSLNRSTQISPSPAPTESDETFIPGEFQIGVISFDMVLGVNKSVKLNVTELAEFVAKELYINISQVHVIGLKYKGNYSVVRWAVFPAMSMEYFSNTTAMSIIMRLKDHHMQLPEKFGGYSLVEVKVQPQKRMSWWKQHPLTVAIGLVASLAIVLLTIGTLLFWRYKKREAVPYERVGAAVPEQELQPFRS